MKKNIKLELTIVLSLALIVIIVAFFIIFSSSREALFGEVVAIPGQLGSCYDTDPSNNLNQVGRVTDSSGESFKDSCLGLFTAVQYNCSSDGNAVRSVSNCVSDGFNYCFNSRCT